MRLVIQYVFSVIFIIQMYLMMVLVTVFFTPIVLFRGDLSMTAINTWCSWVKFTAKLLVGIKTEVRGIIPDDEVLIISKHQSFLDIIMIVSALNQPKFIMKKEILITPIIGFWAKKIGCIPIDRGKKGAAIKEMVKAVHMSSKKKPGQLIIFPQGTRVAPKAQAPYKIGSGVLYSELNQDCVPVATNVGMLWPRSSILRTPGSAVIEFLPRVKSGLDIKEFMDLIENNIEQASDNLMNEVN
jgi:1-acyl-sn-glycerol-3-phosphate acyltransferase